MPKEKVYEFVYEPNMHFNPKERHEKNFHTKFNGRNWDVTHCLYHFIESGGGELRKLHLWVDMVGIKIVPSVETPLQIVLHSDYTLEQLSQVIDWEDQIKEVTNDMQAVHTK